MSIINMKKKGKGLSFDQKREKMLGIFHRTKDVYNYQEIDKLSQKAGIPFPSVKEILNSLRDDNLVESQKIGAGMFYWSFPSKAFQALKNRLELTENHNGALKTENIELEKAIEQGKIGRQQTKQREDLLEELEFLKKQHTSLNSQVQSYIRFDPERYQTLVKQNNEVRSAINTEIDDLEQIKKYLKKMSPGMKDQEIEQAYDIPAELEYYDI